VRVGLRHAAKGSPHSRTIASKALRDLTSTP
jgi:hypothetical protein